MAIAYTNATSSDVPQAQTTIYTVPALTTAVVGAVYIANVHATEDATVDVWASTVQIAAGLSVPKGSTLQFVVRPFYLDTADTLDVGKAGTIGEINVHVSVLEKT